MTESSLFNSWERAVGLDRSKNYQQRVAGYMFGANFAGGIPRLFHLIPHAAQLKRQCWPSFILYAFSMIDMILTKIFRQNNNCSSFFQNFPFDFPLRQKSKSLIKCLNESRSLIDQAPNFCSFQGLPTVVLHKQDPCEKFVFHLQRFTPYQFSKDNRPAVRLYSLDLGVIT